VKLCSGWRYHERGISRLCHIAKLFDNNWLCRYPRPSAVIYDNGKEFTGGEFQELLDSYAIKHAPTTVKNPQANGVVERMHLTLADMLRTMRIEVSDDCPIRVNDALDTILQTAVWSLQTTVGTVTNTSPGATVFCRDMVFIFKLRFNWEQIARNRDRLATRDNSKRLPYEYNVGGKILIVSKAYEPNSKLSAPTKGPFEILKINNNGTLVIQRNKYKETTNIRRVRTFKE
jgi:hypothetical protein